MCCICWLLVNEIDVAFRVNQHYSNLFKVIFLVIFLAISCDLNSGVRSSDQPTLA